MIAVGKLLYGYCNGFFGRDSYDTKRIEAFGVDWMVVRENGGQVRFCPFSKDDNIESLIKAWEVPVEF